MEKEKNENRKKEKENEIVNCIKKKVSFYRWIKIDNMDNAKTNILNVY